MEKFNPEKLTDMEVVLELIRHIDNPCKDIHGNTARRVYIEGAKRLLKSNTINNPFAIKLLENCINSYPEYKNIEIE